MSKWFRIEQGGKRIGTIAADDAEQALVLWQQSAGPREGLTATPCHRPQFPHY